MSVSISTYTNIKLKLHYIKIICLFICSTENAPCPHPDELRSRVGSEATGGQNQAVQRGADPVLYSQLEPIPFSHLLHIPPVFDT